jgi:hypothetical protein
MFTSRLWTIWKAHSGLPNCVRLLGVGQRNVVRRDRVAERRPGTGGARGHQDASGILEALGPREPALLGDADAVEAQFCLPDRARCPLALHRGGLEARRATLDEEALDLPVLRRARPHDDHVGDRTVADPALRAVDDPAVTVSSGTRLQRDRVRAVLGLGESEGADALQRRHRGKPARLLVIGSEQVDRLHGEAGLHPEERTEAAVAAVELHVHQTTRERAHPGASVALDVLAQQIELREPAHVRPRELGGLPVVVDHRQHFLIDEPAGGEETLPLLVGELFAHEEIVSGERLTEMGVRHGLCGHVFLRSLVRASGDHAGASARLQGMNNRSTA